MKKMLLPLGTMAFLLCMLAVPAAAQGTGPISLMTKDEFGRKDIVAIVRVDRSKYPRPIIAIKRSALTPDLLMATLSALNNASKKFGDTTTKRISVEFTTNSRVVRAKERDLAFANGVIASLAAQPERNIAITGKARELIVTPPQNR